MAVTIKIGLENSAAGISTQVDNIDELMKELKEAMSGVLKIVEFVDVKKQKYVLNADKITYAQVSEEEERRVGFVS